MRKLLSFFFASFFLLTFFAKEAEASLLTVEKDGQLVINVLASETNSLAVPKPSSLAVTSAADEQNPKNLISLAKDGGEVSLKIGKDKTFDVTSWKEDLVLIEERQDAKEISISLKDGFFVISQEGISAATEYSINVDPEENRLSLDTPTGEKYLAILPYEALESALRSRVISRAEDKHLQITEENKDLAYTINGEKSFNLFNVYNLVMPIEAKVSASTGEVLSTNEPVWLKLLGFFIS